MEPWGPKELSTLIFFTLDEILNQQEIEKNRATPHHENDPESALPKPKKFAYAISITPCGGRETKEAK